MGDPSLCHMATLARRAGVSTGTLYQYFPDWPSVLSAVLERAWEREAREFRGRLEALETNSLAALLEAMSALAAEITHRDHSLRVAVRKAKEREPAFVMQIDESDEWVRFFANVLRPFLQVSEEELLSMSRSMVWAADGIVDGTTHKADASANDLRAGLLAVWRGIVAG